jgi:hypothetical protein
LRNRVGAIMMSRAMAPKHSLALVVASAAAAIVAVVACSSSSDGGAASSDAGLDSSLDANGADAMEAASDVDAADAAPCSDIPVADGDVYTMCLVASCCFELTQCKKDCTDYKTCVLACSQSDADPTTCIDQCGMQHSNGEVQLHNLSICGNNKCTAPGDH